MNRHGWIVVKESFYVNQEMCGLAALSRKNMKIQKPIGWYAFSCLLLVLLFRRKGK